MGHGIVHALLSHPPQWEWLPLTHGHACVVRRQHQRDSLASRQRTGLPGSRRYRRYLNLAYLTANSSDEDVPDGGLLDERPPSPLVQLSCSALWEPFRNTTEQKERILLTRLAPARPLRQPQGTEQGMDEAWAAFVQLSTPTRQLLKQAMIHHYDLILSLEVTVLHHFKTPCWANTPGGHCMLNVLPATCLPVTVRNKLADERHLILLLDNSRDRKILHGLAKFYCLLSWSETTEHGKRVTVITQHKRGEQASRSCMPLTHYLAQMLSLEDKATRSNPKLNDERF